MINIFGVVLFLRTGYLVVGLPRLLLSMSRQFTFWVEKSVQASVLFCFCFLHGNKTTIFVTIHEKSISSKTQSKKPNLRVLFNNCVPPRAAFCFMMIMRVHKTFDTLLFSAVVIIKHVPCCQSVATPLMCTCHSRATPQRFCDCYCDITLFGT